MGQPMLSIRVPVYNHEKYIARCLDSILMQETQYEFEVLVGEDKSTDNSRAILQDYERRYPGFFTMFYREENMWGKPINNSYDLERRCRGKYVIILEGDDFWTSKDKIEKQITFLEEHPDYFAVAHNCTVVGDDDQPNGEEYSECKQEDYSLVHYLYNILPGQTATVMYRNRVTTEGFDNSLCTQGLNPGDRLVFFSIAIQSKIYCMQEVMSAYRHIKNEGSSFSATAGNDYEIKNEKWYLALMEFARKHEHRDAILCADTLYIANRKQALEAKAITFGQFLKCMKCVKSAAFLLYIKRIIFKKVLKLSPWEKTTKLL